MSMKKRLGAMLLAVSMSAAMSVTAFAAEPNVKVSTNVAGETVYTQTVDVQLSAAPNASSSSKTVSAGKSLGLALAPGKSGFSDQVSFRFTSLPLNAKVKSIEIDPGRGIINNNNKNLLGAVVFSKLDVISPSGKSATIAWKPSGMTERASFLDQEARGTWTAQVFGTNIASSTGDRWFGSLSYKSVEMTISYVLE
ncbi:hypothetical protein NST83_06615 [Paenibacillus sp. FSL R10-2782]|uniref:P/Homo B domain-containing protein n=1 Tax=Paenibacillus terrae TaxID=159743 RepID=A0A4U2PWP2_9BACL|nr:hypothetical protein [Paenibacillus terrae]TKH44232.1 hypothetical protein C1I60_12950 [Paenibacillus terrae]